LRRFSDFRSKPLLTASSSCVSPRSSRSLRTTPPSRRPRGGRSVGYGTEDYRQRNVVERFFNRMKNWRGLASRYRSDADARGAMTSTRSSSAAVDGGGQYAAAIPTTLSSAYGYLSCHSRLTRSKSFGDAYRGAGAGSVRPRSVQAGPVVVAAGAAHRLPVWPVHKTASADPPWRRWWPCLRRLTPAARDGQ
jgi:hypothetical protein